MTTPAKARSAPPSSELDTLLAWIKLAQDLDRNDATVVALDAYWRSIPLRPRLALQQAIWRLPR